MLSISLNEPSPMNPSYTPSFIHTQNQNISHHTHCTIIRTPPYPSSIYKQHQIHHRYTWVTQLEDAAVSGRGWFRLPSARAGLPSATRTSPDTNTAKTTQQDCSRLPNNIASAPGMHSMVPSLRLPAPAHRFLKRRPGGNLSQQCNHSVFSLASRYLRCT